MYRQAEERARDHLMVQSSLTICQFTLILCPQTGPHKTLLIIQLQLSWALGAA